MRPSAAKGYETMADITMEQARAKLDAASRAVVELEAEFKAEVAALKADQRKALKAAKKVETAATSKLSGLQRKASRADARAKAKQAPAILEPPAGAPPVVQDTPTGPGTPTAEA